MNERDRIVHRVDNWEDLLTMSDPIEDRTFASAEHPMKLYVTIKALRKALMESLSSIELNRDELDKTPELKAETDALVVQRQAALAWLAQQTKEHVYLALYPATEFELVEEEPAEEERDEPQE
jgi:hypothetical protein